MSAPVPLPLESPDTTIAASGGLLVRRTVLPTGLRVLSEHVPGASSVTVGFWVPVGSRDEQPITYGSTHFLEHLLFKGTQRRTAFDIAVAFDAVGGEHNALTAKEHTCYYAKVRDRDLPMAVEVLTDMVTSSLLDVDEFESERGVILEELAMADDDPGDVAGELVARLVYGDHALGRPIGGTKETIRAVSRDDVAAHYREHYRARDLVVTVAGAVDHDELVALVQRALADCGWSDDAATPRARRVTDAATIAGGGIEVIDRPLEQVNLMIGMPGLLASDRRRTHMSVMNTVLGAGMSSRLFQEVRERRGLAYSVYSYASLYSDAGSFGMYAGCTPAKAGEVARIMLGELDRLAADGVTDEELLRAKGQIAGASALALEDSDSRMSRLGRAELTMGEFADLDTVLGLVDRVTPDDVRAIAAELAGGRRSVAAVGPVASDAFAGLA
ncbi:M16 family metallopeptidase [Agrococcus jejuensis]|uniref:M16 family metallopeptidase n=1 Tax=Agrococcus jejuensis TaxID=399736 RepID=UPI0011A0C542|nr:pitrilysin family protein [Agrococcus jejuensis]